MVVPVVTVLRVICVMIMAVVMIAVVMVVVVVIVAVIIVVVVVMVQGMIAVVMIVVVIIVGMIVRHLLLLNPKSKVRDGPEEGAGAPAEGAERAQHRQHAEGQRPAGERAGQGL